MRGWGLRFLATRVDRMDVRPGGLWRLVNVDAGGGEYGFRGVYHDVVAPERIVRTCLSGPRRGSNPSINSYMTLHWKLVVDCADPHRQAAFWAEALGYEVEDNSVLIERLLGLGVITESALTPDGKAWKGLQAVRHPDDPVDPESGIGLGRRILFQAVPEPKTVKNRLHIDLHAGPERRDAEVDRLKGLGATVLWTVQEPGSHHVTMADPEGNEFDVQ
ncbi:VOC family protein [Planotetraspora sp. GP83]|uniref:VOC family protein n=1 Tax=Planotetraspora sp. GP83 TaxID=3156264 RepID=UPI00387E7BCE